jgi:invasion protein IalB
MLSIFTRLGWPAYAGGAVVLLAVTLIAVFWSGGRSADQVAQADLPPVQTADIPPGFVGEQPFGAWKLVCQNVQAPAAAAASSSPKRLCRANARTVVNGPNNQKLLAAGFNVLMIDTVSHPAIMFRLPPGAQAATSIGFAIDRNTVFTAPLKCSKNECVAQGALPAEALEQMRAGQKLMVIYTIKDKEQKDRKVRVDQMLYGFPQAFDAMQTAMAS